MAEEKIFQLNLKDNQNILFQRVLIESDSKLNYILVDEAYMAILIFNGKLQQTLYAGKHEILLKAKKSGDVYEVVFFPRLAKFKMLWGTKQKFSFRDFVTKKMLHIGANGEIDVQISNARKIFLELGKKREVFFVEDLKKEIQNKLLSYIEKHISTFMENKGLSFDCFDEKKSVIAEEICLNVSNEISRDFGIKITDLTINGVILPNEMIKEETQQKIIEENKTQKEDTQQENPVQNKSTTNEKEKVEQETKQEKDAKQEVTFEIEHEQESSEEKQLEDALLL